jgi:hypothetical protein
MNDELRKLVDSILIPHTAFQDSLRRLEQGFNSIGGGAPIGYSVIGESGCGKTTLVNHFAALHMTKREQEGLKVPIMMVTTPAKPTIKGMASSMLASLGDPLSESRESENQKTLRLAKILKESGTRVIVIDEIQHLVGRYSNKVLYSVADWLKILLDEAGLMVVIVGLPHSNALLMQNEQFRRRFAGRIRLPRFDWEVEESRMEFCALLEAFQNALGPFSLPDLGNEEMAYRFFLATGGLTGYLVNVLRQVTWDAIDDNRKVIKLEHLEIAYEKAVWEEEEKTGPNPFTKKVPLGMDAISHAKSVGLAKIEITKPRRGRKPKAPDLLRAVL